MQAIVTGHSRGLGAAIAAELLARDIPVLGISRSTNDALAARFGGRLTQITLDLADPTALQTLVDGAQLRDLAAQSGPLLLVNNAGLLQPIGSPDALDADAIARAINLNVTTPLVLTSALTRLHRDELRIVHVSSGAARDAYPGWSVYCATKAALDHHARAVALDALPNVRICSLAPGVIDTDMQAEIRATTTTQFPLREKFVGLKRDGLLAAPNAAAKRFVDYALGNAFGSHPTADLRNVGLDA